MLFPMRPESMRRNPLEGGQAGAAAGTCPSCGRGLNVMAIRKAPIPIPKNNRFEG
jgi:hypothetical protein